MLRFIAATVVVLGSPALLAAGQQVRSFYTGPVASYSTEYGLGGAHYGPVGGAPQTPFARTPPAPEAAAAAAYAYRPAARAVHTRRFEPLVGGVRGSPDGVFAAPAVSAVPAFPAPVPRSRYYPTSVTTTTTRRVPPFGVSRATFRPVSSVGNVAVPAYPVAADVRVTPQPVRVVSGVRERVVSYPPTPYAFEYSVDSGDGSHSRRERGDGTGRVTGSYTIQLADGRSRIVEYIADEGGYRANIRTNEFGTESQSPADVVLQSSAIPAREAVILGERDPAFRQFGPAHHKKA